MLFLWPQKPFYADCASQWRLQGTCNASLAESVACNILAACEASNRQCSVSSYGINLLKQYPDEFKGSSTFDAPACLSPRVRFFSLVHLFITPLIVNVMSVAAIAIVMILLIIMVLLFQPVGYSIVASPTRISGRTIVTRAYLIEGVTQKLVSFG